MTVTRREITRRRQKLKAGCLGSTGGRAAKKAAFGERLSAGRGAPWSPMAGVRMPSWEETRGIAEVALQTPRNELDRNLIRRPT